MATDYPDDGIAIIEVGDPTGPEARLRPGQHQVRIGRRYNDKHASSVVQFLSEDELYELFTKTGDRLFGHGRWLLDLSFRCRSCRTNDHDAEEHH